VLLLSGVEARPGPPAPIVRQCVDLAGEEGVTACQHALAAGLPTARATALRWILAEKLAGLKRWEDVVDAYRDAVQVQPGDPEAQRRLGRALLHLVGRPAEAVEPLQEAIRLQPGDASAHADLGVALAALGRLADAVEAFDEAARIDPGYLGAHPAAQATYQAARRGESWP